MINVFYRGYTFTQNQYLRVSVSSFYQNTRGVCGVDREEIGWYQGVQWILIEYLSVLYVPSD